MINNVFSKWKTERRKSDVDVNNDFSGIIGRARFLAKISQLGWLGTPNKGMPLEFIKLGMVLSVVHSGS